MIEADLRTAEPTSLIDGRNEMHVNACGRIASIARRVQVVNHGCRFGLSARAHRAGSPSSHVRSGDLGAFGVCNEHVEADWRRNVKACDARRVVVILAPMRRLKIEQSAEN